MQIAKAKLASRVTAFLTAVLLVFGVACEIWLAPLRPGGSLLVLKGIPLLLLLPGLWSANLKAVQWLSLLIMIYLTEGLVRGVSDPPTTRYLGWIGAALSLAVFAATLYTAMTLRALKRVS